MLIRVVGLETEGLAYVQECGKRPQKALSDKKEKEVGAPQATAVGSRSVYPGGRQEGSRKVWGVEPQGAGAATSACRRRSMDRGRHPLDTAQSHRGGKRPGSDQRFSFGLLRMFMCFVETGPYREL